MHLVLISPCPYCLVAEQDHQISVVADQDKIKTKLPADCAMQVTVCTAAIAAYICSCCYSGIHLFVLAWRHTPVHAGILAAYICSCCHSSIHLFKLAQRHASVRAGMAAYICPCWHSGKRHTSVRAAIAAYICSCWHSGKRHTSVRAAIAACICSCWHGEIHLSVLA